MAIPFLIIHSCDITVTNAESYTLSFPSVFNTYFSGNTPIITATASEDVSVFVDDVSLSSQNCVLRFSTKYSGKVYVTAIVN